MISMEAATKAVGPRTAHHRLITGATCDKPQGQAVRQLVRGGTWGAREVMRSKAKVSHPCRTGRHIPTMHFRELRLQKELSTDNGYSHSLTQEDHNGAHCERDLEATRARPVDHLARRA